LCPKQYQLTRIVKVPEIPAWWNIGGSAVHAAMESYDHGDDIRNGPTGHLIPPFDVELVWRTAFADQIVEADEKEPDRSKWRQSTGKNPPRSEEEWNEWGPIFIQRYVDWRKRAPWTVWVTPDGEPAIELDVSGKLFGFSMEMEVKGFIDRVFHDPITDSLWILDLKSGSKDATIEQLGTYSALLEEKYRVRADKGLTFNVRRGSPSSVKDLSEWVGEAGEHYENTVRRISAGDFTATPGNHCNFMCGVKHACAALNGAEAWRYDPDHHPF
jgi:putative RecB family exonuclease